MSKQIHYTISDDLYMQVQEQAAVYGISTQQLFNDAVISYINKLIGPVVSAGSERSFDFIDLFAGIGGMRIAFEKNGGRCVFSSEWDKKCQETYFANFGVIPNGDITAIDPKDIPDHDILVAGFPCQPFSIAGVSKKNSMGRATGFEDKTQGTLFFNICKILEAKRPKAFMLENVKNLKSHDHGHTWEVIEGFGLLCNIKNIGWTGFRPTTQRKNTDYWIR